jgi:hypothetical protein
VHLLQEQKSRPSERINIFWWLKKETEEIKTENLTVYNKMLSRYICRPTLRSEKMRGNGCRSPTEKNGGASSSSILSNYTVTEKTKNRVALNDFIYLEVVVVVGSSW